MKAIYFSRTGASFGIPVATLNKIPVLVDEDVVIKQAKQPRVFNAKVICSNGQMCLTLETKNQEMGRMLGNKKVIVCCELSRCSSILPGYGLKDFIIKHFYSPRFGDGPINHTRCIITIVGSGEYIEANMLSGRTMKIENKNGEIISSWL